MRFVIGFIRLPRPILPCTQTTAGTHVRLPYGKSLGIRIVRDSDQIPYTAAGIAEASEHTEILIVGQFEFRSSERFGPLEQPLRGGGQTRVPLRTHMRTVAVRLLLRCPTATQGRRLVVGRVMLSFGELPTLSPVVRHDELLRQRRPAEYEHGALAADRDAKTGIRPAASALYLFLLHNNLF